MVFIVLWLLCPLVLIPLAIVFFALWQSEKNKRRQLEEALAAKWNAPAAAPVTAPPVAPVTAPPVAPAAEPAPTAAEPTAEPAAAYAGVNGYNLPRSGGAVEKNIPVANPSKQYAYSNPTPPPVSPETKQNRGSAASRIVLIIGTLFVILSGLIFATTTWFILPPVLKLMTVAAFAGVFFALSVVAEKKLHLRATGEALFAVGAAFLPLGVLIGGVTGVFATVGTSHEIRFSVALAFALLSVTMFIGAIKYRRQWFSYVSLGSVTGALFTTLTLLPLGEETSALLLAVYALLCSFLAPVFAKCREGALSAVAASYDGFVVINTAVLAVLSMFMTSTGVIPFAVAAGYSVIFLRASFNRRFSGAGALPFAFFMLSAFIRLISPEDFGAGFFAVAAAVVTISLISMLLPLGEGLKKWLRRAAEFITYCGTACAGLDILISGERDILFLGTLLALIINTYFMLWRQDSRPLAVVGAIMLPIFFDTAAWLLCGGGAPSLILTAILLSAAVAVFRIPKIERVRSAFSDIFFPAAISFLAVAYPAPDGIEQLPAMLVAALGAAAFFYTALSCERISAKLAAWLTPISITLLGVALGRVADGDSIFTLYAVCGLITLFGIAVTALSLRRLILPFDVAAILPPLIFLVLITDDCHYPLIGMLFLYSATRAFIRGESRLWFSVGSGALMATAFTAAWELLQSEDVFLPLIFPAVVAAGYFVTHFCIKKLKINFKYNKQLELSAIIGLIVMTVAESSVIFVEAADLVRRIPGMPVAIYSLLFTALTAALCLAALRFFRNNIVGFIPMISLVAAVWRFFSAIESEAMLLEAAMLLGFILSVCGGLLIQKKILSRENGLLINHLSVGGIYWSVGFMLIENRLIYGFVGFLMLAAALLLFYRRMGGEDADSWALSASAAAAAAALRLQPFFTPPALVETELHILPLILFAAAFRLIWRGRKGFPAAVSFAAGIIAFVTLIADAFSSGRVADAIIIGAAALSVVIVSFPLRRLRWFALGAAVLVFLGIYMSAFFWGAVFWWGYLLIVGLVLIAFAAFNELKKRSDSLKEKISRIKSEWEW